MRKAALLLASAAVFDLGIMVVSGQARASAPRGSNQCGQIGGGSLAACKGTHFPDAVLARVEYLKIKMDRINTPQACLARNGRVIAFEGAQQCEIKVQPLNDPPTAPVAPRAPRN